MTDTTSIYATRFRARRAISPADRVRQALRRKLHTGTALLALVQQTLACLVAYLPRLEFFSTSADVSATQRAGAVNLLQGLQTYRLNIEDIQGKLTAWCAAVQQSLAPSAYPADGSRVQMTSVNFSQAECVREQGAALVDGVEDYVQRTQHCLAGPAFAPGRYLLR